MKEVNLWGYKIFDDGRIIGLNGNELKKGKQLKIKWKGKGYTRTVSYARFVYYAFNLNSFDFDDKTVVVCCKDKSEDNYSISNLVAVERKYITQGEYNVSAKLTNQQIEEIKKIYREKDLKSITNRNNPITNISYRKIAELYGVSHSMIAGIVKGQFRNKENYILK